MPQASLRQRNGHTLTVIDSQVDGNRGRNGGGADAGAGGEDYPGVFITITNSTLDSNRADAELQPRGQRGRAEGHLVLPGDRPAWPVPDVGARACDIGAFELHITADPGRPWGPPGMAARP